VSLTNSTSLQWVSASGLFSVAISLVALFISAFTLWKSYLTPFRLEISYTDPTFCLYKIKPDKIHMWWIPSFDLSMSFYNKGQKTGKVLDIRILANFKSRSETFSAKWIVRYSKFFRDHHERSAWLDSSIERDWHPLILPPNRTVHIHLILEGFRWDAKEEGVMEYRLEILSSESKRWKDCAHYHQLITADLYDTQSTSTSSPD
jgi:hypothetical protein